MRLPFLLEIPQAIRKYKMRVKPYVRDSAAKNTGMPDVIPTLRNIKCFLYGAGRGLFTHVTKLPCREREEKKQEKMKRFISSIGE